LAISFEEPVEQDAAVGIRKRLEYVVHVRDDR
jgi:hypothetical protein